MTFSGTSGPWERHQPVNSPDIYIVSCSEAGEPDAIIATVNHRISFVPGKEQSEEAQANARLIAAAPFLLETLISIGEMSGEGESGEHDEWTEAAAFSVARKLARAAITKATQ